MIVVIVVFTPRRRDSMMRAARYQGQSGFAGYYCYRGEPEVGLAGKAPFRYAGHAQVVNGEQAAAQLIIFREAREGRLRH